MKNARKAIDKMRKNGGEPYRKVKESTDRLTMALFLADLVEADRLHDEKYGISY